MTRGVCLALIAATVLLLAGCATGTATPAGTGAPVERCAGHGLPCGSFVSVSGSDASGDLAWLATSPVGVSFVELDGRPAMVVGAPCAPMDIPISVKGSTLEPRSSEVITGSSGCAASAVDAGEQAAWVRDFVGRPMTVARDGQGFSLTSGTARMAFSPTP